MGYVSRDQTFEVDARRLDPASASAEQIAAVIGGIATGGGSPEATLTLLSGIVAHKGDWVVRLPDGTIAVMSNERMHRLFYLVEGPIPPMAAVKTYCEIPADEPPPAPEPVPEPVQDPAYATPGAIPAPTAQTYYTQNPAQ